MKPDTEKKLKELFEINVDAYAEQDSFGNSARVITKDVFISLIPQIQSILSEEKQEVCSKCFGTGQEICDNPDHGFRDAIGGTMLDGHANGCPCCGNDELHRIPKTICDICNGSGKLKTSQDKDSPLVEEIKRRLEEEKRETEDPSSVYESMRLYAISVLGQLIQFSNQPEEKKEA